MFPFDVNKPLFTSPLIKGEGSCVFGGRFPSLDKGRG